MSLKSVYEILQKIAEEPKTLKKLKIIKENKENNDFKNVVFYALDYNKVYNLTRIDYYPTAENAKSNKEIFSYLDHLAWRNGSTLDEKRQLSELSSCDKETIEVVTRIVRKDLRCGSSIKTFLKIFPDLPYFEMMTCSSDLDKYLKLINKENTIPYWSQKKDGVRTWAIYDGENVKYLSRSGLSYFNFSNYNTEIRRLSTILLELGEVPIGTPIDGESIVPNGNFQDVMKNVRTLDQEETPFQFNIFDYASSADPFEIRYQRLKSAFDIGHFQNLKLLEHNPIENPNKEKIEQIMNSAVEKGDEGIVLKLGNSPYEFKEKSKYWCKVKPVETYDLLVIGTYKGKKGKKFDDTLGGLIVKFKDKEVHVGSGFSEEERKQFLENPPRLIEVNCKGVTEDGSLREPRFIRIRDDKLTTTDEE